MARKTEKGVWALVAQQLVSCVVNTFTLNRVVRFNLSLKCSYDRLKVLIPYGSKVLGTSLLVTVFMELRSLIIGKLYSPASLAYFDRGRQFPNLLVANINTSIGAVLFPKMSSQQDDIELVKQTTRKSIRLSSYIMSPLMLGLAAAAEPFVRLILTEKWIDCVPLLQIFCIIFLFQPVHTANTQAIKAIGRSDITLKLEFIKKCIENHRINLDNITDEKSIKYLMGFRHFSTERVIKSMTYMLTDTDAWSVKGRLMGECWYKDCCILENGDRKHIGHKIGRAHV